MADYNVFSCVSSLGNTGLSQCLDELGYDAMLVWATDTFEIDTYTNAMLEATWLTAINAKNVYPMPQFDAITPDNEDDVKQDLPTGSSLLVREGKYGGVGMFQGAMCNLPNLRTFNNVSGRVFIVTSEGYIIGTTPDGTKMKGLKLSEFFVSGLKGTDGSTKRMFELTYQLLTPAELNDNPAVIKPTAFSPLTSLTGIVDVTVAISASAAAEVTFSVTRDCDDEAVDGLVIGDFTLLDSSGNEELPGDDFTDNGDGTYTLDFSVGNLDADTYTLNLKAASAQTTGQYEGTSASFTIS